MSDRIKMTRTIPGLIKVDEAYGKKKFYREKIERTISDQISKMPNRNTKLPEGES